MTWKNDLRTASFRGVKFQFEEVGSSHGRRLAKHEYPLRDLPYTQDMGRKQRGFTVNAYIVGDDYVSRKDALIEACEKAGPGEFIHPLKGSVTVNCESLDVRENKNTGRMATFTLTFVETGLRQFPAGITDANIVIGNTADSLMGAGLSTFLEKVTVFGVPEYVRTALQGGVADVGGIFKELQTTGALNLSPSTQALINQAANFSNLIEKLGAPSMAFITDVVGLGNSLLSAFKSVGDLSPTPKAAVSSFQKLQTVPAPLVPEYTQFGVLENQNRVAVQRFTTVAAIAQEARYTARQDYEAYEDAVRARKSIVAKLETLSHDATDEEYNLIRDLSAEIVKALPAPGADLPHIQTVVLAKSVPAIKMAYDLYEDSTRDEEISKRNKARHPGFLPGGRPLEVLTDA